MTRNTKVKLIVDRVMNMFVQITIPGIGTLDIQVESMRPNTFVKVSGSKVNGRGWSKVSAPDEWDAQEGLKIAAKRAARDYLDNVDKWENLTDGE